MLRRQRWRIQLLAVVFFHSRASCTNYAFNRGHELLAFLFPALRLSTLHAVVDQWMFRPPCSIRWREARMRRGLSLCFFLFLLFGAARSSSLRRTRWTSHHNLWTEHIRTALSPLRGDVSSIVLMIVEAPQFKAAVCNSNMLNVVIFKLFLRFIGNVAPIAELCTILCHDHLPSSCLPQWAKGSLFYYNSFRIGQELALS